MPGRPRRENRDVLFIQTIRANGKPMVYRNEDTGWGWPPYFKFNTANLQTEAADAISDRDDPRWYAISHYGWRNELISIFPNAVALREVAGPDTRLFPWFNVIFLLVLVLVILTLRRLWMIFWNRRVDPVLDRVDDRYDETRGKIGRFFDRIVGKGR
jgi:hypothetical protein